MLVEILVVALGDELMITDIFCHLWTKSTINKMYNNCYIIRYKDEED